MLQKLTLHRHCQWMEAQLLRSLWKQPHEPAQEMWAAIARQSSNLKAVWHLQFQLLKKIAHRESRCPRPLKL
eukprot:6437550-Amphidinium_carterae.1